jgi:hypothetical protein
VHLGTRHEPQLAHKHAAAAAAAAADDDDHTVRGPPSHQSLAVVMHVLHQVN